MRKIISTLACVALMVQALPPLPGQTTGKAGSGSGQRQQRSTTNQKPTTKTVPALPSGQPVSSKDSGNDIGKENPEYSVKLTGLPPVSVVDDKRPLDYILLWGPWFFAFALVLVGAYQVWLMTRQTEIINRQANIMDRQRQDSNDSSTIAAGIATGTLDAIKEQVGAMNLQYLAMQSATQHAGTQAEALTQQVGLIGQQLHAIQRQADLMEAQVKIMEAPYEQWIEIINWHCVATEANGDLVKTISVRFDIENPTQYLLVIPSGNINFALGDTTIKCFTGDGAMIAPKTVQHKDIWFSLTEGQAFQFKEGELPIGVRGDLDFVGVLGKNRPTPISGTLWCDITGARFESDVIWQHSQNGKGEEEKAN